MAKYDMRPVSETLSRRIVFMQVQPKQTSQKGQTQFRDEVRIYSRIFQFNG